MTRRQLAATAIAGTLAALAGRGGRVAPVFPESLRVEVVRSFPHDSGAFTQGLVYHAGKLFESTGLVGRSSLRRVDPATGAVEALAPLDRRLFGEGLALAGGRLVQLTGTSGRALRWEVERLAPAGEWAYRGEGWGLCADGTSFWMSDGSDQLVRRRLDTFEVVSAVFVHDPSGPVRELNELECVGPTIYANVWHRSRIARIDTRTGGVTAWIDAGGLLSEAEAREADVLNGIAHIPSSGRFVLTGKLWPRAFEVEFVPAR